MITYTDITRYDNLEFGEYLELKGFSHSFLKSEVNGLTPMFKVTDKVLIGKMVDAILSDPGRMDMLNPLYPIAKSIAFKIKEVFGSLIDKFEKQVSYTGTMNHQGFSMSTTGRLDYRLPEYAVIDLKVTHEKDVHALIKHMGYQNQLFNYAHLGSVLKQYIMIHSVPLKETKIIDLGPVSNHNDFWAEKILKFGRAAA